MYNLLLVMEFNQNISFLWTCSLQGSISELICKSPTTIKAVIFCWQGNGYVNIALWYIDQLLIVLSETNADEGEKLIEVPGSQPHRECNLE